MAIGNRFPKLRIDPATFEKHKTTLLLTGAASGVGAGALFLIDALGFVGDAVAETTETLEKLTVVIEEATDAE